MNSKFIKNVAGEIGGGINIQWDQSVESNGNAYASITTSVFQSNQVRFLRGRGLAFHVQPSSMKDIETPDVFRKFHVNVSVSKCNFSNHTPKQESKKAILEESSVILIASVPQLGIDAIIVEFNNCTAILAVESKLLFSGSTIIRNNTALIGGGLQLTGSTVFFTPYTDLTITNNYAEQTGGGVQVHSYPGCTALGNEKCFYEFSSEIQRNKSLVWTVNFTISNNHAPEGGDNIFGIIDYCNDGGRIRDHLNVPRNEQSKNLSLSSNPQRVCIEKRGHCEVQTDIVLYPGQNFTFPLRVVGQSYGSVRGTVSASPSQNVAINPKEELQSIDMSGSNVTYTIFSTQVSEEGYLNLLPVKFACTYGINSDQESQINVTFRPCPFGFSMNEREDDSMKFECQCNRHPVIASESCSLESQTISKKSGLSWLGTIVLNNHTYLAGSSFCPFDYCDSSIVNIEALADGLDVDKQCQYNRTGVLCGSCPEGWSLVLGSSECCECSSMWLLLTLPFALAGLLLVVVIHFLNLTVTMGTVSGLIFYANVIQDHSIELLSKHHLPVLTPVLQVFLSWLNLDLGISTCFYDGMEAFGKTMLLFVFPIYIWLISATIIILSNRFISFTKLVGKNSVKVLSTLILLSYSKMLRVAIGIFDFKYVEVYNNNMSSTFLEMRWAVDGTIPYFDLPKHLVLFAIAVILIVVLLPFSIYLLCIQQVYRLPNYGKAFSWIDKFRPFFDTYTGPFKDKTRFWTGLLLFVRLLLLVVRSLDYGIFIIPFYVVVTVCLFLLTIMFILQGVYKSNFLNVLEFFFILNICIVFLINTYYEGHSNSGYMIWKSVLSHVLVSFAFLAFLGIVFYHALLKFSDLGLMTWLRNRLWFGPQGFERNAENIQDCQDMRGYEPVEQSSDEESLKQSQEQSDSDQEGPDTYGLYF